MHIPFTDADNNPLCDDHAILRYADIHGVLAELDRFFKANNAAHIHCLALKSENSLSLTFVLLYLLSAKINFYLQSSYNAQGSSAPPFCDFILTSGPVSPAMSTSLRLEKNPDFSGKGKALFPGEALLPCEALLPGQGAALFSSSGTSGRPKFILYRQDMLIRNAENCARRFGFTPRTRVLIPVPIGHMYGLGVGLLPALLSGAGICLIDKNNIVKFLEKTASFQPTFTLITPTIAKMLLTLGKPLAAKCCFVTAGEKIRQETWLRFESAYGPLANLYGSTEMGAIATTPANTSGQDHSEGILQPLGGVQIKISGTGQGEVLCRHTAGFECYVDDNGCPLQGSATGNDWYATRDFGRDAGEGKFMVMGRMDNCINRSGFLVSLEEVGTMLENLFPEISQAVVFDYDEGEGLVTGLAAVCEVAADSPLEEDTARKRCRSEMKSHFVPDTIRLVQDLPRLGNGKPDRVAVINQYKTILSNKK